MYQKCPVCDGRQTVPAGFYAGASPTDSGEVMCRTCNGAGTLWAGPMPTNPRVPNTHPSGEPWVFKPADCVKCRSRGNMICICMKMAGATLIGSHLPDVAIGGH